MISILPFILAILKAIPILDKWFQDLQLAYVKRKVEQNDQAFIEALSAAKVAGSTKDLQALLGAELDD